MIRSPLPVQLAALAAAALATVNARAAFFFSVDSPQELTGTFSKTGNSGVFEFSTPSAFTALPGGSGLDLLRQTPAPGVTLDYFVTHIEGTPDIPSGFSVNNPSPLPLSGTYTNGGPGGDQTVNWSFTNFHETGINGLPGEFSGSFSFILVTPVPEPAETAAVVGLGLGAFAWLRRNRKAAAR
jgi:hypothetical protein